MPYAPSNLLKPSSPHAMKALVHLHVSFWGCENAPVIHTPTLDLPAFFRYLYRHTLTQSCKSFPLCIKGKMHDNTKCMSSSLIKWKIDLLIHILQADEKAGFIHIALADEQIRH